jgi:RNA polymerase sigma-70 factor (ECF subfamily)
MDKDELEKLYAQYFPRVYRTAFFMTGDHQTAEDIVQEAFLKAFANLHKLQDRQKFGSWISVIASNHAVDFLRKHKKIFISDNMEEFGGEAHDDNPSASWEREENIREIREALARLEPEDREILVLKYFNELSINEIASMLAAPPGTIKSRLFRARDKVRLLLQPQDGIKRPIGKEKEKLPLKF